MALKSDTKKILDEALQLEPAARAVLAETLLESLDMDEDFAVSQEWQEEILKRCADIDSGKAVLTDSAQVINELREKYNR